MSLMLSLINSPLDYTRCAPGNRGNLGGMRSRLFLVLGAACALGCSNDESLNPIPASSGASMSMSASAGTSGGGGESSTTGSGGKGTGGGLGSNCNYGDTCATGYYCDAVGCGAGTCAALPGVNMVGNAGMPVCGCDGVTYWNSDVAAYDGASV